MLRGLLTPLHFTVKTWLYRGLWNWSLKFEINSDLSYQGWIKLQLRQRDQIFTSSNTQKRLIHRNELSKKTDCPQKRPIHGNRLSKETIYSRKITNPQKRSILRNILSTTIKKTYSQKWLVHKKTNIHRNNLSTEMTYPQTGFVHVLDNQAQLYQVWEITS